MKYPCKECLVQAACTKECDDYRKFMRLIHDIIAPISIAVIGLIFVAISLFIIINYDEQTFKVIMSWTWGISLAIIFILTKCDIGENLFGLVLLAPLFAPCIIFWKILIKYYKRT